MMSQLKHSCSLEFCGISVIFFENRARVASLFSAHGSIDDRVSARIQKVRANNTQINGHIAIVLLD